MKLAQKEQKEKINKNIFGIRSEKDNIFINAKKVDEADW